MAQDEFSIFGGLNKIDGSESGKSTLVKQFRLMQSSETFVSERESWRRYAIPMCSVIY